MAVWTFARTSLTDPRAAQRVRVTATARLTAAAPAGAFNLANVLGDYFVAFVRSGDVWVKHSSLSGLPYQWSAAATATGDCSEPRVAVDPLRRCHLIYTRTGPSVREKISDDEARTWNAEATLWATGKHPDIVTLQDGSLLKAAWVANTIQATYQAPGDTSPSAPFTLTDGTSNLSVQDDSFRLVAGVEGRIWLHVRITAEATTSLWFSTDDGRTFARYANLIGSGSHPGLAAGIDGSLLAWAYKATNLHTTTKSAGETNFSTPAALLDSAAAALVITDDVASFTHAYARHAPWLLVLAPSGSSSLVDYGSHDEGLTAGVVSVS